MQFWQAISFAPPEQLAEIAVGAEAAGFEGLAIPDHVVTPMRIDSRYPYAADGAVIWDPAAPYPEPWILAAALAQVTRRLRFLSYVYVLPLRDPFTAAKSLSSAALLSGNRVVAGVGAGWLEEEFRLLGRAFRGRGERMDEMLEVIGKLMAGGPVEHRGKHYAFGPLQLSPVPDRPVPIWVGGHSDAALRRAARADGWLGANLAEPAISPLLARLARARESVGHQTGDFAIALALDVEPSAVLCHRLAALGVTGIVVPSWLARGEEPSSLAQKLEGLDRFGREVIEPLV
jgi:probable F420-dependent oxidoreductase